MIVTPKKFKHNSVFGNLLCYYKNSQPAVHILNSLDIDLGYDWLEY